MPTRAFLKLAPERREEVLSVCREEFAKRGYAGASTNAMVARLGVAKGSLFYWFGNKDELYLYLVDEASRRFTDTLGLAAAEWPGEVLARLRILVEASLDFLEASPTSYKLFMGFLDGQARHLLDRYVRERMAQGLSVWANWFVGVDTSGYRAPPEQVQRLLVWVIAGIKVEIFALVDRTAEVGTLRVLFRERLDLTMRMLEHAIYERPDKEGRG